MLVILEMANNHQGSVEHGIKIIDAFTEVKEKFPQFRFAFKFQYRRLPSYIHPTADRANKYVKRFLETNLLDHERKALQYHAKQAGFVTVCAPFDETSIRDVVEDGYGILKVGSPSIDDWPLWEKVYEYWAGPIIASVGGASDEVIQRVVNDCAWHGIDLTLLHCVSKYPTVHGYMQLNQIKYLMKFGVPVGYSSHAVPGVGFLYYAAMLGAEVIERHVCIDPPPNNYSATPECLSEELDQVRFALECLGTADVRVPGPVPTQFKRRMIDGKMWWCPEPQFPVAEVDALVKAAGIVLPKAVVREFYHHLGPDNFRKTGACIYTCFNGTYCKKYIVLLPGQTLPQHKHDIKEETFTLIHGDVHGMVVGETYHIKPGEWHSLTSNNGAVIEEISTEYLPNDSVYRDELINQNMAGRKTKA